MTDLHIVTPPIGVSPTPDAYRAACEALEKHRQRADKAEAAAGQLGDKLTDLARRMEQRANEADAPADGYAMGEFAAELRRLAEEADRA